MKNSSGQVYIWVDLPVGLLLNIKRECFMNGIINFPFGSGVFIKHIAYSVTKSKVSQSKYGSEYLQPKVSGVFGRVAVC